MSRSLLALVALLAIALGCGHPAVQAQQSCEAINFNTKNTALITGSAPPEDAKCFQIDGAKGRRISLKILKGDNVVFSIEGLTDAQHDFKFSAEKNEYRLYVGQMMRAVRSEPFRISISRSADQSPNDTQQQTTVAQDERYCTPKSNAARILTKPSPNATHPDWSGDSFVGLGWSFVPKSSVTNVTGKYAVGDLRNGRSGEITNRGVFVLLSEWDCSGDFRSDISPAPSTEQPEKHVCEEGPYGYAETNTFMAKPLLKDKLEVNSIERDRTVSSWSEVICDNMHRVKQVRKFAFGELVNSTSPEYQGDSNLITTVTVVGPDGTLLTKGLFTRDEHERVIKIESKGADGNSRNFASVIYQGGKQISQVIDGKTQAPVSRWEKQFHPDGAIASWKVIYPNFWYEYHYNSKDGRLDERYLGDSVGPLEKTTFQHDEWHNLTGEETIPLSERSKVAKKLGQYSKGNLVDEIIISKDGVQKEWRNTFDGSQLKESRLYLNDQFAVHFVVSRNGSAIDGTTAFSPDGQKLFYYPGVAQKYINRDGSPVDGGNFQKFADRLAW